MTEKKPVDMKDLENVSGGVAKDELQPPTNSTDGDIENGIPRWPGWKPKRRKDHGFPRY